MRYAQASLTPMSSGLKTELPELEVDARSTPHARDPKLSLLIYRPSLTRLKANVVGQDLHDDGKLQISCQSIMATVV